MGDVKYLASFLRLAIFFGIVMLLDASGIAASVNPTTVAPHRKAHSLTENQRAKRRMRTLARSRAPRSQYTTTGYSSSHRRHRYYERFHTSSFASEITDG